MEGDRDHQATNNIVNEVYSNVLQSSDEVSIPSKITESPSSPLYVEITEDLISKELMDLKLKIQSIDQKLNILMDLMSVQDRYRKFELLKLVQSWKLKFPDKDMEPSEFIIELRRKIQSLNLSEAELLIILPEFFVKNAKSWCYSQIRVWFSWEDFEKAFRIFFCDIEDDDDIWVAANNSCQGKHESAVEFIVRMQKLFNKMSNPRPLKTQLDCIIKRLNPEFKRWHMIIHGNIKSYEKLVQVVREVETMISR